jgi:glutathione S-transferase
VYHESRARSASTIAQLPGQSAQNAADISSWRCGKGGKTQFYPTDPAKRANMNRWLLWEASTWFSSCYVYLVVNCVRPLLGDAPDPAVLAGEDERFHKLAGILDERLSPYSQEIETAEKPAG